MTETQGCTPGWSATPRGRRELAAIVLFALANVLIPLLWGELYPFSSAPMFYDAPQCYCDYTVTAGPECKPVDLVSLGLHRTYWGNPPDRGMGIQAPPSIDRFGTVACQEEVFHQALRWLDRHPEAMYLTVTQSVIGPVDDLRVGKTACHTWRVSASDGW